MTAAPAQDTAPSDIHADASDAPTRPLAIAGDPGGPSSGLPAPFRIAYLRHDRESPANGGLLERLRAEMMNTPQIRDALRSNQLSDISIDAADSFSALVEAMTLGTPDLVFCSSVAFVAQSGEYDALFQLHRPGDVLGDRGGRVMHRGAIITGNRGPLFREGGPNALRDALARGPVAMVASHSAAGYVFPTLRLRAIVGPGGGMRPPLFLESSEEVVKAVLSGTVEVGACDAIAIDGVLQRSNLRGLQMDLIRVLDTTDLIPTDPIALKTRWRPSTGEGSSPGVLGREIRDGLRRFFHRHVELPRLEPAAGQRYEVVRSALLRLKQGQAPTPSGATVAPPEAQ